MRCTQSGIYTKWKQDSIKIGGYSGNFEERKQDLNDQFEFIEITVMQQQANFYSLIFGIIIAMCVLVIEFYLKDSPQYMLFSYNHHDQFLISPIEISLVYSRSNH